MNFGYHDVPEDWDLMFITNLVAVGQQTVSIGVGAQEGEPVVAEGMKRLRFAGTDYQAFVQAVETYPTAYLSTLRGIAKKRIAAKRREKLKQFSFGPIPIDLDDKTEMRLANAHAYLNAKPEAADIKWDLGDCDFMVVPRDVVIGLAIGLGDYMQACFTHSYNLWNTVEDAVDINDPVFASIENGWPTQ